MQMALPNREAFGWVERLTSLGNEYSDDRTNILRSHQSYVFPFDYFMSRAKFSWTGMFTETTTLMFGIEC